MQQQQKLRIYPVKFDRVSLVFINSALRLIENNFFLN